MKRRMSLARVRAYHSLLREMAPDLDLSTRDTRDTRDTVEKSSDPRTETVADQAPLAISK
jgi:hypothetical protein